MLRNLMVIALLLAVCVVAYVGCGPRARVAGKKVLDQIDSMLGKLNVQQEKIESAYADLTKQTEGLREKRIEAEVRLNRLEEKKVDMEVSLASKKEKLVKLRDLLTEAGDEGEIEVNGNKVQVGELKVLAEQLMKEMKMINSQLSNGNKTLVDAWTKNLSILKNNEVTSKAQLKTLGDQIVEIRAKKSALDAMKEASMIEGAEVSISDRFNELSKDVDDLMTEVDVKMQTETEKVDERMADAATVDVRLEDILEDKSDVSSTLSDIDKLLAE